MIQQFKTDKKMRTITYSEITIKELSELLNINLNVAIEIDSIISPSPLLSSVQPFITIEDVEGHILDWEESDEETSIEMCNVLKSVKHFMTTNSINNLKIKQ